MRIFDSLYSFGRSCQYRWHNIIIVRDDNLAMLRNFLARKGVIARTANISFNLTCKAARICRRFLFQVRKKITSKLKSGATQTKTDNSQCTRIEESLPYPGWENCFRNWSVFYASQNLPQLEPCVLFRRPKFCAIIAETSISQCLHYRVEERIAQLHHLGWEARFCDWRDFYASRQMLQLASCVLFYRVPIIGNVGLLFKEARRLHLPILFDIDDLIFDRERYAQYLQGVNLPAGEIKGLLDLADMYHEAMQASDTLLASTSTLAGMLPHAERNGKNVVHNTVSDSLALLATTIGQQPHRKRDDDDICIFYGSGSKTHDEDFALIAEPLLEALQTNKRLHLYLHGHLALPPGFSENKQVHHITFLDKKTYYRTIAEYDIALMPLKPTLFNDAKSNIKYQEASIFGIPSIVSPCADFLEAVTDGENGLIAHTPEQWRDAVLKLAASPELRARLGENARQNVLTRYSCAHVAETELRPLLPAVPESEKTRVLLVNVFFGENSFGGATMVVEDTARELAQQGFEVSVFCTGCAQGFFPNELRSYNWNGIQVAAFNHPFGDEKSIKQTALSLFQQVLYSIRPHIVHFHCIQDFGPDLLQECRHTGIPYVITMHDGWWICPRQFMLDVDGQYCAQTTVRPETCKKRCALTDETLYRRRLLMRDVVAGAACVLTPSAFYTEFVRRNFPDSAHNIRTNRNGIRKPGKTRTTRAEGPLRLAFLGGKTLHKGYFFLAEALHRLKRTDFELLLVDVHTAFGNGLLHSSEDRKLWKGLPVSIHPFVAHDVIDELYLNMDILLFPSLWDESFGLTIREAIMRNIFIIASDCGGPSECIVPEKNGLIFPKGDLETFCRHLHYVLDNKEYFMSYRTTDFGDIIDTEIQTRELAEIYRNIIEAKE